MGERPQGAGGSFSMRVMVGRGRSVKAELLYMQLLCFPNIYIERHTMQPMAIITASA